VHEVTSRNAEALPLGRRAFLSRSGSILGATALLAQAGRAWSADTSKLIRMAVVGGGFGASFHWHLHPQCKVTAVTDLRPDRRETLKNYYQCDAVYPSLEVMLQEAKDVDAVAIFSGAPDHVKHTVMCMSNGWHVACAVPACMSLEEAETLRETKERTGLRYMLAESSYYRQDAIHARNLFREGVLGEIVYTEAEYYHDRGDLDALLTDKTSRFYEPDGTRSWRWGLSPMLYATHSLAFVPGITGERLTTVSAIGWGDKHPWVTENRYNNPFWNVASIMQTDKGHMLRNNVFFLAAASGERAQFFGEKATLYMESEGVHGPVLRFRTAEAPRSQYDLPKQAGGPLEIPEYWKSDMLPPPMRKPSGHGNSAMFISAEFINALIEDREPAIDLYEGLAMNVPGIIAQQSAMRGGELLKIPQFTRP
jgi:predicted dehydrogenase